MMKHSNDNQTILRENTVFELSDINVWATIVTWLISVGVGSFWYSPAGFGKQWSRLSGIDMMHMPKDEAGKAITAVAVASLVQVVVMALIVGAVGATTAAEGIVTGLLAWAGFTAATTVGNNLYSRLSWKFWWLNASFFLVVMPLNAVVLSVWR
jgi:hypothetical protein